MSHEWDCRCPRCDAEEAKYDGPDPREAEREIAEAVAVFIETLGAAIVAGLRMTEPAKPYPKAAQLARGERRYRRKVASPKQWQAIVAAKQGPCRCCNDPGANGKLYGLIQFHHVVSRAHGGDDVADNIVPLCTDCHANVTARKAPCCEWLLLALTDAEYAYLLARGGPDYPQRGYGVDYSR